MIEVTQEGYDALEESIKVWKNKQPWPVKEFHIGIADANEAIAEEVFFLKDLLAQCKVVK